MQAFLKKIVSRFPCDLKIEWVGEWMKGNDDRQNGKQYPSEAHKEISIEIPGRNSLPAAFSRAPLSILHLRSRIYDLKSNTSLAHRRASGSLLFPL